MTMPATFNSAENSQITRSLRELFRGEWHKQSPPPDIKGKLATLLARTRPNLRPSSFLSSPQNFQTRLKQERDFPELKSAPAAALEPQLESPLEQDTVSPVNTASVTTAIDISTISNNQESVDLDLFEQVLDEVEANREPTKQTLSASASEANPVSAKEPIENVSMLKKPGLDLPPLAQSPVSSARKETEVATQFGLEQGAGAQVIEQEKKPELSPEVEKYLQEVGEDKDQAPKEIAIADEIANLPKKNQFVSQPVIVLPITPEIEERGKRKSPKYSIRWLVEWSQKIIKMFTGKVIYLQPSKNSE